MEKLDGGVVVGRHKIYTQQDHLSITAESGKDS